MITPRNLPPPFQVLIETQQRFRSNVPGMTFNLGFSGQFFSRGTEADVEGNKALIGNASRLEGYMYFHGRVLPSLVPRPTCAFHFSAAVGLVYFLTCVTRRVEGR